MSVLSTATLLCNPNDASDTSTSSQLLRHTRVSAHTTRDQGDEEDSPVAGDGACERGEAGRGVDRVHVRAARERVAYACGVRVCGRLQEGRVEGCAFGWPSCSGLYVCRHGRSREEAESERGEDKRVDG